MADTRRGTVTTSLLFRVGECLFRGAPNLSDIGVRAHLYQVPIDPGQDIAITDLVQPVDDYDPKICIPYTVQIFGGGRFRVPFYGVRSGGAVSGKLTWYYQAFASSAQAPVVGWALAEAPTGAQKVWAYGPLPHPIPFRSLGDRIDLTPRITVTGGLHITNAEPAQTVHVADYFPQLVQELLMETHPEVRGINLSLGGWRLGLYTGPAPAPDTWFSRSLPEPSYPGYSHLRWLRWSSSYDLVDDTLTGYLRTDGPGGAGPQAFTFRPSADAPDPAQVAGWYLAAEGVAPGLARLAAYSVFNTPVGLAGPGDSVTVTPVVRFTSWAAD